MKTSKQAKMYAAIQNHGEQLNAIFHTPFEPIELCKKLHRLELAQHRAAEQYCNGDIDADQYEAITETTLSKVRKILGDAVPVMVNHDCRGYSLKLSDDIMREKCLILYKDWGGFGILAPDFSA